MELDAAIGFLSYAHSDNDADEGRIVRLAEKLEKEYYLLTGHPLTIFVDRKDIKWGQQWKARVDGALQNTTFFIPVLTEAFFDSDECRREFLEFYTTAKNLGVSQYLLAIRYSPVRDLTPDNPEKTKAIAARTQYKDWTTLRLEDESGSVHRKAVNNLAEELRLLMELVENSPAQTPEEVAKAGEFPKAQDPATAEATVVEARQAGTATVNEVELIVTPSDDPYGDEPSPMELVAEFAPRSEAWVASMQEFPALMKNFTDPMERGGAEIKRGDAAGKPFAHRIVILRQVAKDIEKPSIEIEQFGNRYTQQLLELDSSVRALFELARNADVSDPAEAQAIQAVSQAIITMSEAGATARDQVQSAIESGRNLARMSRDLRPAIKRYESGTRNIVDGQAIIDEWSRIAEETSADALKRATPPKRQLEKFDK